MVEFETMREEEKRFGKNNFLLIARKKVKSEDGDENEFISISRGFFDPNGRRKWKASIAIPDEEEIKDFISTNIKEI